MTLPFNNDEVCGCCRRRCDGWAVGRPNRLLWGCNRCGPPRLLELFHMPPREFDVFEKRALKAVRDELMEGDLVVPDAELLPFLEWLINTFGEKVKEEVKGDKPPF